LSHEKHIEQLPWAATIKLALLHGIKINQMERFIMLYEPADAAEAVVFNEYLSSGLFNTLNQQGRTQRQLDDMISDYESESDERLSECCGAGPENDLGICPECKEHCEFLTAAELEGE
jgi:hypothetical protein